MLIRAFANVCKPPPNDTMKRLAPSARRTFFSGDDMRQRKLTRHVKQTALIMWHELESSRLEVVLVPCENGRANCKIRKAISQNPDWYQRLCAEYTRNRRQRKLPDTLINRQGVLRALSEITEGNVRTLYARRVLPYVYEEAARFPECVPPEEDLTPPPHEPAPILLHMLM